MTALNAKLRALPAIHDILGWPEIVDAPYAPMLKRAAQAAVENARDRILEGLERKATMPTSHQRKCSNGLRGSVDRRCDRY